MAKCAALSFRTAALAAALAVAGCGDRANDVAELDNQIVGNDADPALTSALEDQILVDPALTQQSNKNAVRPPETPTQAQYPLAEEPVRTAGRGAAPAATPAAASGNAEGAGAADCAPSLQYHRGWAQRLPAELGLYPGARVGESAGSDRAGCRVRIVTFTAAADPERVLDWYRSRAAAGGYSAERQMRQGDHILAGANERTGAAYYLILTPRSGGSDVALIVNAG